MASKVDWVFLNADQTKHEATLPGDVPSTGDGKSYNGRGYVVRYIVGGRTTSPNDLVIATEHQ